MAPLLPFYLFVFYLHVNPQVGSKEKDAVITKSEFEHYYANLSASIDRDDYFELMIRNAWHISGGEGWAANTTNRRVLVTHADGRQTVEEIKVQLQSDLVCSSALNKKLKSSFVFFPLCAE